MRVLDLELCGYTAARLGAEDLLAGDPAVVIHQAQPALQNGDGQVEVPFDDREEVEAFIPEEATREKRAGWGMREEC